MIEAFFGISDEVPKRFAEARESAREKRMREIRAVGCGVCVGDDDFGGVAIATAGVQNVVRLSCAKLPRWPAPKLDSSGS